MSSSVALIFVIQLNFIIMHPNVYHNKKIYHMEKRKDTNVAMSWVDRAMDKVNATGVSLLYIRKTDRLYAKKKIDSMTIFI